MPQPDSATALISATLNTVYEALLNRRDGELADYIPQLGAADPECFGISLCSVNGSMYSTGDADVEFTIQSVSKPFVYSLALDDRGLDAVHAVVNSEPSGEAFNSVKLEQATGRPPNPMVNAGAIVTSSLVNGDGPAERFARILARLSAFAGRDLSVDEAVFASEQQTGDRNRALAYLVHSAGVLRAPVEETLDIYFRQCSILVTTRDLAVMGATLANGGVNPVTRTRVTSAETCQHVLTIMATCGMYDYAGEWLLRVGLPAKSGVAGGLVAASAGEFGVGLYSPRLSPNGASVRSVEAAQELAKRLGLHILHYPIMREPRSLAPEQAGAPESEPSEQDREIAELLHEHADDVAVWQLHGFLDFAAAERLLIGVDTWLAARPNDRGVAPTIVLDFSEVTQLQSVAVQMFGALADWCQERGIRVIASDPLKRSADVEGLAQRSDLGGAVREAADSSEWA